MAAGGTLTLSGGADVTLSTGLVYSFIVGVNSGTQGVQLNTTSQTLQMTNQAVITSTTPSSDVAKSLAMTEFSGVSEVAMKRSEPSPDASISTFDRMGIVLRRSTTD